MSWHTCLQSTTCGNWLSPSTMLLPGIELRLSDLVENAFTHKLSNLHNWLNFCVCLFAFFFSGFWVEVLLPWNFFYVAHTGVELVAILLSLPPECYTNPPPCLSPFCILRQMPIMSSRLAQNSLEARRLKIITFIASTSGVLAFLIWADICRQASLGLLIRADMGQQDLLFMLFFIYPLLLGLCI